jgi:hypothetical protein
MTDHYLCSWHVVTSRCRVWDKPRLGGSVLLSANWCVPCLLLSYSPCWDLNCEPRPAVSQLSAYSCNVSSPTCSWGLHIICRGNFRLQSG